MGGAGISIYGDPGAAQMRTAEAACRKLMPGGGPPQLTPAQQAQYAKGVATFARCMRTHGVPSFPDPNGQGQFAETSISRLDTGTPLFKRADKACQSQFPTFGPQISFRS